METKIYRGKIYLGGESDETVCLDDLILAEAIQEAMDDYGKYLSVSYYISLELLEEDKLIEEHVKMLYGIGEAEYSVAWSEITGYLWTNEEINVGGHDLLNEIRSHESKFIHLIIGYSHESKSL